MLGKIAAIVAAAVCATLIVTFAPGFASQVIASAPNMKVTVRCVQAWPNYEPSCLRDDRRPAGQARVVRIIPLDRVVAANSR